MQHLASKGDRLGVMIYPTDSQDPDRPFMPMTAAFAIEGGGRADRVRTFWPYKGKPEAKLKRVVYQVSSDHQNELGHNRLVAIFEDIDVQDKMLGVPFFIHMIYGRGLILPGEPDPKDHSKTKHRFFDTLLECQHTMEWVIDNQDWWWMRHHDHNLPETTEADFEVEEGAAFNWSRSIQ